MVRRPLPTASVDRRSTRAGRGASSELSSIAPGPLAAFNDEAIADVADTDPEQLAKSMIDVVGRFVDAAARRPDGEPVRWHAGIALDTAQLAGVLLAEYLVHALDIAAATGAPWPIDPGTSRSCCTATPRCCPRAWTR